jgi:hypothetical protein
MVCNTHFWTLSVVGNSKLVENTLFRKLGMFLSSGERRKVPTQLSPSESGNLSDWTVSSYTCCLEFQTMGKFQRPCDSDFNASL